MSASHTIAISRGRELRLTRELTVVKIRVWFQARDGAWRPGQEGLDLPVGAVGPLLSLLARLGGGAA